MKQVEYEKVLDGVPRYEAVFEVVRVPNWAIQHGVKKGDRDDNPLGFHCCAIQPSYLKFVEYKKVN